MIVRAAPTRLAPCEASGRAWFAAMAILCGLSGPTGRAVAAQAELAQEYHQPIQSMLLRMDQFLHAREVGGVTRDPRSLGNPAEEIRLTVVPQLLGYRELYRTYPNPVHYQDIVDRADYLVEHIAEASSGSASDGMLGCALLAAWEVTGDPRYRAAAQPIIDRGLLLTSLQARLNWGLMTAMALAEYARLTGDPVAAFKARQIVWGVYGEQSSEGSFPHYCPGTRDVHYTAWMAMEMVLIGRSISDPVLETALERAHAFLRGRVDALGVTHYQDDSPSGIVRAYFSLGTGCSIDYDTRGWINEIGYLVLLFGEREDAKIGSVLSRLRDLEDRGSYADKWDYFPEISDPIYPWASSSRSVIRTSVVFWSLASLYGGQARSTPLASVEPPKPMPAFAGAGTEEAVSVAHAASSSTSPAGDDGSVIEGISPNPTPGECWIGFRAGESGAVRIEVFDALGRRVRELDAAVSSTGVGRVRWDGLNERGTRVGRGLYFVRVAGAAYPMVARVVVTD